MREEYNSVCQHLLRPIKSAVLADTDISVKSKYRPISNFSLFRHNPWQPLVEPWLKNTDLSYICTAHFSFQMQLLNEMQNKQQSKQQHNHT